MKRNMELVRKILIYMSENSRDFNVEWGEAIPGYSREEILHHVHLMGEGNLVNTINATTLNDALPLAYPMSITWNGHEFLDAIRDPSVWEKANASVIKPAGGVAFTVLLEWAKAEALRRIGLS